MKNILPPRAQRPALPPSTEAGSFYASPPEESSLHDYWGILVKRRNMVVVVFLIVLVIGGYFSFTATPLYKASSILKIEPQNPSVTGVGELLRLESGGPQYDYYQTQFMLLRSNTLAAKVITELKLDANKIFTNAQVTTSNPVDRVQSWIFGKLSFIFGKLSFVVSLMRVTEAPQEEPEDTEVAGKNISDKRTQTPIKIPAVASSHIGRYKGFLEVKPIKNTRLVEIGFSTPNPRLSQQLADAHARGFIQLSLENRFALTKDARDFLDGKNAELKQKLERSEDALNRFRQTHGVVSMEKGENIVVERLVDLNRGLTTARAQRIEAESLYKVVENKSTQSLSQVVNQGMVPTLRSNLLALEAEKVKSSSIFKPDHPRMVELNQQISEMKRSLNTEISNVVRGIQESFFAARSKEQALQAEAQKQQQAALNLKEVGVQYAVLEEEVKVNRALYESVLKRLNETNISNDIAISNMQITQNAERPGRPFTPNSPLNLLVYALVGLSLGVGVAFLREFVDSTVGTPEDVWRSVGLGTLGVVPHLKFLEHRKYGGQIEHTDRRQSNTPLLIKNRAADNDLIISHNPHSMISECYRTIRTSLLLSQSEKPPQVVLLTSPSPGEGKTVTTLNLAIALAQDGHTVLLVDGDMRKGRCHSRLGLKNNRGLANVLTGGLSLEEGIQQTPVSGLSLLSRGVLPPNPSELLGSHKMREILIELRQTFDFVLIDSPPVIAISDASILSVLVDGVLLVFNGQTTSTAYAQKAVERLEMIHARLLGVILNGVNLDNPHYSFYRTYAAYYQSNGNGLADGHNGASPRESDESVDRLSKILGVDKNGPQKTEADRSHIEMTRLDPVTSSGDIQSPVKFEARSATDSLDNTINKRNKPASPVSRQFINRLIDVFMEAVGPMAPLIVRDQIARLGEYQDAFPKSRIDELVKLIAPEIFNSESRKLFQQRISEELRNLDRH